MTFAFKIFPNEALTIPVTMNRMLGYGL